ncbi:hypothetical protein D1872_311760 [compost metagenome]
MHDFQSGAIRLVFQYANLRGDPLGGQRLFAFRLPVHILIADVSRVLVNAQIPVDAPR